MRRNFDESLVQLSPLSGDLTLESRKVVVEIYRDADSAEWTLEVLGVGGISTVWQKTFDSDKEALQAFLEAVANFGIAAFSQAGATTARSAYVQ